MADVDDEAGVEALTFLSDLVKDGLMSKEVVNWGQGDAYNAFLAGKAAILESGTWQISTLDGQDKVMLTFEYQYVPMQSSLQSSVRRHRRRRWQQQQQ